MNSADLIARNQAALDKRQPGDIIFFHPASFNPFGYIILFFTGQFYHHGAIVINQDTIIEADPFQGVHVTNLETYFDKYILDLFRLKDNSSALQIADTSQSFLGWQYDYGNVLWAGIGYIWYQLTGSLRFLQIKNPYDVNYKADSEEYIDLVFKQCNIDLRPDIPTSNITAQKLADSDLLYKVI